jgi:hypothetical protein
VVAVVSGVFIVVVVVSGVFIFGVVVVIMSEIF